MPWANGSEPRLRSCGRQPSIVVSRVTTTASAPLASARCEQAVDQRPRRCDQYSWNHRGRRRPWRPRTPPSGCSPGWRTTYGTPARPPPRAIAQVAAAADQPGRADRREQDGSGQPAAEQRRGQVAAGGARAASAGRSDALERRPVGPHRRALARAARDVRPGPRRHRRAAPAARARRSRRDGGSVAQHPRAGRSRACRARPGPTGGVLMSDPASGTTTSAARHAAYGSGGGLARRAIGARMPRAPASIW